MEEIKGTGPDAADAKGQLRIDQGSAEVSYANFALVATGPEEFVLNLGVRTGEDAPIKISDKVVMSPKNAKRLAAALAQSVRLYEERFGTIDASFPTLKEKAGK